MAKYSGLKRDKNERSLDYSEFELDYGENITIPELNMIQKYMQEHYDYKPEYPQTKEEKRFHKEIMKFRQDVYGVSQHIIDEYWRTDGKIKWMQKNVKLTKTKPVVFYMRYPTWVRADNDVRLVPGQGKLRVLPFPKTITIADSEKFPEEIVYEEIVYKTVPNPDTIEGLLNEYRKSVEVRKRRRKENKMKKELAKEQLEKQRQKQKEGDRRDMERKKREDAIRMSRKL